MYIQNRDYSLNGRNAYEISQHIVWVCIIKKHIDSDKYVNKIGDIPCVFCNMIML